MLQLGADAPEFSVNDHNGNAVQLKNYRGKKIILWLKVEPKICISYFHFIKYSAPQG